MTAGERGVVVLIPAYRPGAALEATVDGLLEAGMRRIVVVDDGCGAAWRAQFARLAARPGVTVVGHAVNLGKGAALKTGINHILYQSAGEPAPAIVTADADGQHAVEDIVAVARAAAERSGALVLGARQFDGEVPLRSRLGNQATRLVMRVLAGQKLSDTQTGLRAIPPRLQTQLLSVKTAGYEFELDMLLLCRDLRVPIAEHPIRTIYTDRNAGSHFNPLLDSMRIYFVLLRFAAVSLATALIDNLLFGVIYFATRDLVIGQVGGRIAAMLFNFATVKSVVFKSRHRVLRELAQYVTLVAVSGSVSYGLIRVLSSTLGMGVLRAKLCAEAVLFFANFLVQRDVIFTGGDQEEPADQTASSAAGAGAGRGA